MEEDLVSDCSLVKDMFQPLLIISKAPTPEKALETLVETSKTAAGRGILANTIVLVSALQICQKLSYASSSHLLLLTLKLVRNLCAGERINQDLFLSCDGVGIISSTIDAIGICVSKYEIVRMAIQVLANVALAGEKHQINIWSRFFPNKFHELARLRKKEICDPLCMVIYTCCDGNGLFGELCGDRGFPVMDEIIRTASRVGNGEDWLNLLLSKICFEVNYFPELFSRFFTVDVAQNGKDANFNSAFFGEEQLFLLDIISSIQLHEICIPINFASGILDILKKAVKAVDSLPEEKCSVPMGSASIDVLAYSLAILRDVCANTNESTKAAVNLLSSSGLVELLLSMLGDLEPPEMIRKAMKQSGDKEEPSTMPKKPCLYKGFRRDVVSVIANCAYRRKYVQDKVRERNGIPLLLQHCVTDEDNPFLREWGLWAMRNLLEENVENQQVVAELELQGSVDVPEITNVGMKVEIDPITRRAKLVNLS